MSTSLSLLNMNAKGSCVLILCLSLNLSACATDGQNQFLSGAMGALAGVGCGLGAAALGAGNAGAVAAGVACAVGAYALTSYLTEEEQKAYTDNLNQSLKKAPNKKESSVEWSNPDGSKKITTEISQPVLPAMIQTSDMASKVNAERMKTLPEKTSCRVSTAKFLKDGKMIEDKGVYCRDQNGDYVRVDNKPA